MSDVRVREETILGIPLPLFVALNKSLSSRKKDDGRLSRLEPNLLVMVNMSALHLVAGTLLLLSTGITLSASCQSSSPITVRIDLTDAPRHLVHVTETLPVHVGENEFSYPEWIPGLHLPGGPIDNLTGIVFHAGGADGQAVPWRRDLVDLYSFHVQAPAGTSALTVTFDVLEVPSRANTIGTDRTSSHIVMLEPSEDVLYPTGAAVREIPVAATVHLPAGWSSTSALRKVGHSESTLNGQETTFATVSMEQFVDSPILAGDHCRQYPIAPEVKPVHTLDVCTEKAADLELQPEFLEGMNKMVRQAGLVFKSHHYEHYDFMVAVSSHLQGDSIEHAQSVGYVVQSLDMKNEESAGFVSYLLPHEYTHSWCGKYRRPAGMATAEYHTPQQDDLLWVYEGLTQYYGEVLASRAGFRSAQQTIDYFVFEIYNVDQPGRRWRTLQDTADASPILRGTNESYGSWRRGQDYYREGTLLWLEVDMTIRMLSGGKKSLDDFAARFLSANPMGTSGDGKPGVFPYRFEDVVKALNETQAYDWAGFWTTRLNELSPKPPTEGFEKAGYTYGIGEEMVPNEASFIKGSHSAEMFRSLGFFAGPDGVLRDVWMGSPAFVAGLGPGDKLTAVNGQPYTAELLTKIVHDSKTSTGPIILTASRDDETATHTIDYHGGEKYAVLKRNGNPDVLTTKILAAR